MIEIAWWTRSLGRRPPEISAHPHGHADLGMAEHLYDGRAGRPDLLRRVAACRRLSDCLLATIGRRITLVAELAGGRGGRGPGLIYRRCRHPGSSWRLAVGRRRFRDRGRGPPDRHGRGHLEVRVVRDRPDRQPDAGLRIVTGLLAGVYAGLVLLTPRVLTLNSPVAVAASAPAAAALFTPLRRRVQRVVDRRLNRVRYDGDRMARTRHRDVPVIQRTAIFLVT